MIENKKWICYKIITGHANGYTEIRNSARCGESEETKNCFCQRETES